LGSEPKTCQDCHMPTSFKAKGFEAQDLAYKIASIEDETFPMVDNRAPDAEIAIPTLPQQALLYRLCGDRNPLHSDPGFAKAAGFDRPILHGLCTYGIGAKAIVDHFLDGDVRHVGTYGARFAGTVIPGETLQANIWKQDGKYIGTLSAPSRDNTVVLSGVELIPSR
jgi:acyl dehydratase